MHRNRVSKFDGVKLDRCKEFPKVKKFKNYSKIFPFTLFTIQHSQNPPSQIWSL